MDKSLAVLYDGKLGNVLFVVNQVVFQCVPLGNAHCGMMGARIL